MKKHLWDAPGTALCLVKVDAKDVVEDVKAIVLERVQEVANMDAKQHVQEVAILHVWDFAEIHQSDTSGF